MMPSIYDAAVAAAHRAERLAQAENAQNTRKTESYWSARDAGKPMSVSGDLLDLSEAAQQFVDAPKENSRGSAISLEHGDSTAGTAEHTEKSSSLASPNASELTQEEQQKVAELQARDAEVRTHEAAHLAAAGPLATSGASYTYETGPDGKKYAVGGEVSIDTAPVKGDPQATLEKAQTIQRAALAPAQPSGQDRKVAAAAAQMATQARQEIAQQGTDEPQDSEDAEQSGSAFQLIREVAAKSSASSPATYYANQSRMASGAVSQAFSAYA